LSRLCNDFGINYAYSTLPIPGARRIAWDPEAVATNLKPIAEARPEALALVQFSSGSTSVPKPVPISHANLMANLEVILSVDYRAPLSSGFNFLPLSHDMGLIGGLLSNLVYQNALLVIAPGQFLRRPVDALVEMHARKVDVVAMPEFALRYLARYLAASRSLKLQKDLLSSLRTIYCGAEPIRYDSVSTFLHVTEFFGLDPRSLFFCYGLAEATLLVTGRRFNTLEDSFDMTFSGRTIAKVGPALGGAEIRICATDIYGKEKIDENGEEGAVHIRGPSLFQGYWGGSILSHDAWFDTGDIGFLREGELHISGRSKDMIIVNGENLFPTDIENAISDLSGLRESLVMVEEDRFYILAVPSPGAKFSRHAVSSLVCKRFGMVPRAIIVGSPIHIVRTSSGKPIRDATLTRLRQEGLLPH
jgi:fatty-acyl-CoA synthase